MIPPLMAWDCLFIQDDLDYFASKPLYLKVVDYLLGWCSTQGVSSKSTHINQNTENDILNITVLSSYNS